MPPIPSNALYALLAASFWGMGDFSGGMSVKSAPTGSNAIGAALRVVLFSHLASFSVLVVLVLALRQPVPSGPSLAWGIGAGILAGSSLVAFYMALSRGAMGASAAISGLLAAAIPSAIEIVLEGSPGAHRLLGFAISGVAIWLIAAGPSRSPEKVEARSTMLLALFAGVGFGLYFAALKFAGTHSTPLWTMASARTGSIATCALTLLFFKLRSAARSQARTLVILSEAKDPCIASFPRLQTPADPIRVPRRMALWILSTALFDTSGNLLFVLATRAGRLDIASVLASLYPAGTILLAAATLGERPTGRHLTGMGVAAVAVILIAL